MWSIILIENSVYNRFHKIMDWLTRHRYVDLIITIKSWDTEEVEPFYYDGWHHLKNLGFISIYWRDFRDPNKE